MQLIYWGAAEQVPINVVGESPGVRADFVYQDTVYDTLAIGDSKTREAKSLADFYKEPPITYGLTRNQQMIYPMIARGDADAVINGETIWTPLPVEFFRVTYLWMYNPLPVNSPGAGDEPQPWSD